MSSNEITTITIKEETGEKLIFIIDPKFCKHQMIINNIGRIAEIIDVVKKTNDIIGEG